MKNNVKKKIINSNHQCPNCNSYYTEELQDSTEKMVNVIFFTPFALNLMIAIVPFLGRLVRGYLLETFIWGVIGGFILANRKKTIIKVRCNGCNAIFEVKEKSILDKD